MGLVLPMTVCGSVTLVVGPPLCRQGSVPPFLLYWASPKPPIACLAPDTWGEIVRLVRSGSGKPQNARVIRDRRSQGMPRPLPWTPKPFLTPAPRKHSRTLVTWSLQCQGLLLSLQGPSSPATWGEHSFPSSFWEARQVKETSRDGLSFGVPQVG